MTETLTLGPETIRLIKLRETLNLSVEQAAGITSAGRIYWLRVEAGDARPDLDWVGAVTADLEDYAAGKPPLDSMATR